MFAAQVDLPGTICIDELITAWMLRAMLAWIIPFPARFSLALTLGVIAKPLAPLFEGIGLKPLAAMLRLARLPARLPVQGRHVYYPEGPRKARVALLSGCANPVLAPSINEATIRLLNRLGCEVVVAEGAGCCGALPHHMGQEASALALARANVEAWGHEIDRGGLDAVVINASGCGTTVKDYGFMLRLEPEWAARAAKVSAITRDISELLLELGLGQASAPEPLKVAYHSACSLQHGQKITAAPKQLESITFDASSDFSCSTMPPATPFCGFGR